MPSKAKKTLRQRKQPQSKTAKDSNYNDSNDDDYVYLNSVVAENKVKKIPHWPELLIGFLLLIGAICYLATTVTMTQQHGQDDKIGKSEEETQPTIPENQRRHEQEADDDGVPAASMVPSYGALRTLPHETKAFTQGLCFLPNNSSVVYESTGMYNESEVRIVDLSNGDVLQRYHLPEHFFGEGMTYFPDKQQQQQEENGTTNTAARLVLLTYREQTGFVFNANNLEVLEEFHYKTTTSEGWGITYNPRDDNFIVSDGSAFLHFWDRNFKETGKIEVKYKTKDMQENNVSAKPLSWINELEWDHRTGMVLANVYFQDLIVAIDPNTGYVERIYDLRLLYKNRLPESDVFNGIALSSDGDIWVTGKYWPHLYQIQLEE